MATSVPSPRRGERQLYVRTPLLRSRLSELVGADVWLKMESVQTSGSFKTRGLSNFAKKVSRDLQASEALRDCVSVSVGGGSRVHEVRQLLWRQRRPGCSFHSQGAGPAYHCGCP